MTEAELWRDMESRFRAIPDPHQWLRAEWTLDLDHEEVKWQVRGSPDRSVCDRFGLLAADAGAKASHYSSKEAPLILWLNLLMRDSGRFEWDHGPKTFFTQPDGSRRGETEKGTINRLCEVSADHCMRLARQENQAEQGLLAQRATQEQTTGAAKSIDHSANPGVVMPAPNWEAVEISFTSDERVQFTIPGRTEAFNYGELGFVDNRNGTPNRAWKLLRTLAECKGSYPHDGGKEFRSVEKRVQELRKALRALFVRSDDPIPKTKGVEYKARFKIGCGRSFES